MKPAGRGCGTCKDRRISCDRGLPVCLHCVRSHRHCQGYGMRLSWPKANDRKRAMLGAVPPTKGNSDMASPIRIVNTSSWDLEIHYYLASPAHSQPTIPAPMSWNPIQTDTERSLLQYFEAIASNSLVSVGFSEDSPNLREVLIRVALSNNSPPSVAVLQSLLAFSSIHRYGLQPHAARLKLSALSALTTAAKCGVQSDEVIPHIAAGMLLCCFEIQQASETSSQWSCYISGIKNVLKAASLSAVQQTSDMAALLYWVSYHDTLSWFSFLHWRHGYLEEEIPPRDLDGQVPQLILSEGFKTLTTIYQCPAILALLAEVLKMVLDRYNIKSYGSNYESLLTILEWRIREYPIMERQKCPCPGQRFPEDCRTLEVYQLALLVYLERMSSRSPRQSDKICTRVRRAFELFEHIEIMQRQFPLLILGCEARTDDDRMVVLDLISRTEQCTWVRNLGSVKSLIQSLWAQDDLAEQELGYADKIKAVLSSSATLPAFV